MQEEQCQLCSSDWTKTEYNKALEIRDFMQGQYLCWLLTGPRSSNEAFDVRPIRLMNRLVCLFCLSLGLIMHLILAILLQLHTLALAHRTLDPSSPLPLSTQPLFYPIRWYETVRTQVEQA